MKLRCRICARWCHCKLLARDCTEFRPQTCDYCGERPADGYVPQYLAVVCQECYEDYHGTF